MVMTRSCITFAQSLRIRFRFIFWMYLSLFIYMIKSTGHSSNTAGSASLLGNVPQLRACRHQTWSENIWAAFLLHHLPPPPPPHLPFPPLHSHPRSAFVDSCPEWVCAVFTHNLKIWGWKKNMYKYFRQYSVCSSMCVGFVWWGRWCRIIFFLDKSVNSVKAKNTCLSLVFDILNMCDLNLHEEWAHLSKRSWQGLKVADWQIKSE